MQYLIRLSLIISLLILVGCSGKPSNLLGDKDNAYRKYPSSTESTDSVTTKSTLPECNENSDDEHCQSSSTEKDHSSCCSSKTKKE